MNGALNVALAALAALLAAIVLQPSADARPLVNEPPLYSGSSTSHAVAITFDDGPGRHTLDIVRRLRRANARATFFQLGVNVAAQPALARRAGSVGELANHTYTHRNLMRLSSAAVRDELRRTSAAIERAAGQRPTLFRPPYGSRDARVDAIARELGLLQVLWSVDTEDWRHTGADALIARIQRQLRPGGIVLFHDHGHATLAALDWLLRELPRRGLRAVTVSELLASR